MKIQGPVFVFGGLDMFNGAWLFEYIPSFEIQESFPRVMCKDVS